MRLNAVALLLFIAGSAYAHETLDFSCAGDLAPDTSHQRLVEAFGAGNVAFGEIMGDEGTIPLATTLFPNDPARRLSIVWRDEADRRAPRYVLVPSDSAWTVGGLRVGMTIDEVEALNGGPFHLGGFNDIDRGRVVDWAGGNMAPSPPPCDVDVSFGYRPMGLPLDLNDPLQSEGPYSSDHPSFRALGARIVYITISYPSSD